MVHPCRRCFGRDDAARYAYWEMQERLAEKEERAWIRRAREIVKTLHAAINDGLKSADIQASFRKIGADTSAGTTEEFAAFIAAEVEKWRAVAASAGITVD